MTSFTPAAMDLAGAFDAALEERMEAARQHWVTKLVPDGHYTEDELRTRMDVAPAAAKTQRGRPAKDGKDGKTKASKALPKDRCTACGGAGALVDEESAQCRTEASGCRTIAGAEVRMCDKHGKCWDTVWHNRRGGDNAVSFGNCGKSNKRGQSQWYGIVGVDRVPIAKGEAYHVITDKFPEGHTAKSFDMVAGGKRGDGCWHVPGTPWVVDAPDAKAEAEVVLEHDASEATEADAPPDTAPAQLAAEADATTAPVETEMTIDGVPMLLVKHDTKTYAYPSGWVAAKCPAADASQAVTSTIAALAAGALATYDGDKLDFLSVEAEKANDTHPDWGE
jgi:hypothetical protein